MSKNDKEKNALSLYVKRLYDLGLEEMIAIPTYQAPDHYKKALFWEDMHYRWIDSGSLLHFRESGCRKRFIPAKIRDRFTVFTQLLTTGHVDKTEFERCIGQEVLNALHDANLAEICENDVYVSLRVTPTPAGPILADAISQTTDDTVHIGLDSMLFWNFLFRRKKDFLTIHNALDMGCGTGIHSLLLKSINPDIHIVCADISRKCLEYTKDNMILNGVDSGITYTQSDWFARIEDLSDKTFDVIVCNPPFEWRTEDEQEFRTIFAYGGSNYGMETTLSLIRILPSYLKDRGKGYILSQSLVSDDNKNLLVDSIHDTFRTLNLKMRITIHVLYKHLLVTEFQMKHMVNNSLSHYAMLVIEIDNYETDNGITLVDDRPLLKRISDKYRVKNCRNYWKNYLHDHA